jgi:hypothetical protein
MKRNSSSGNRRRGNGSARDRERTNGRKSRSRGQGPAILSLGLSLAGFDLKRQKCSEKKRLRRFRSHYGVGPDAIAALLSDLKRLQPEKTHNVSSLFMTILWLKLYETEEVMAGRWGFGEEYCRNTVKEYISRIQKLKAYKISFEGLNPNCTFLPVDCMHVRTQEFRCSPSSKWYSHKFNGPGVSFEVVADPMEGKIRWINGPEPASIHDLTFLRGGKKGQTKKWKRSSLYFHLPKSARLIGDSAYEGQPDKVSTTKDAHKPATKKLFARMKSMQETCFKRFKDFRVLRESFRHGKSTEDKLAKIKSSFEAVAVLLQYDFENGARLFEV